MKRRMQAAKTPSHDKKKVVDPKSFSPANAKKTEPDVFPSRKSPVARRARLKNVRI